MAIFLMMVFFMELIPASAFADPVPPKQQRVVTRKIDLSKCPKFDQHGNLLNPEVGMPNIPTASNPLAWAGDAKPDEDEKREDTPETDPLPKVDEPWFKHTPATNVTTTDPDDEKPAAEATPAAPKRYAVPERKPRTTTYSTDDKALRATPTEEKPEVAGKSQPSPNSSNNSKSDDKPKSDKDDNKKPSSGSSSSGSSGSNKDNKDSKSNKDDDKDKDHDKEKDRDDEPEHCHQSSSGDLGIVIPPLEMLKNTKNPGIRKPAVAWSRLTSQLGSYFEMKGPNLEAFVNDYAVAASKEYTDLAAPGKTEIVWDIISPERKNNRTSRNTYASISFTVVNCCKKPTTKGACYTVETKVWDQNSPHGRKLKTLKDIYHLKTYQAFTGFNLTEAGNYTFKERRDGRIVSTSLIKVSEIPTPPLEWMTRTSGNYSAIIAPFAARVSDEWLVRKKEYQFPVPTRPGRKVTKKIEWNWKVPEATQLNRTKKHSYLSVEHEYSSDGRQYELVTTVYDPLHRNGHVYKVQKGNGNLPYQDLIYGVGIPVFGDYSLQEKINGVETESLKFQSRHLGSSIKMPTNLYTDNGIIDFPCRITTAPASYIEPNYDCTVTLFNAETGAEIRQIKQELRENTKNDLQFAIQWDGKDSAGNSLQLGGRVSARLKVEVPHNAVAQRQALAQTVNQYRAGLRMGPEFELPRPLPHTHNKPKSSSTRQSGAGSDPGGSSEIAANNGMDFYTLASGGVTIGVTHKGLMIVSTGPTGSLPGRGVFAQRQPDDPINFEAPTLQPIDSITLTFQDENQQTICGEFGPVWLFNLSKGYSIYLGSQADYENPCMGQVQISGLIRYENNVTFANEVAPPSTGYVTAAAALSNQASKVQVAGVGVQVASGQYDLKEADLVVANEGLPIVVSRGYYPAQYQSFDLDTDTFPTVRRLIRKQFGWVWNFQQHLRLSYDDKVLTYLNPNGGSDVYNRSDASSPFVAVRQDDTREAEQINDEITLTEKTGYRRVFKKTATYPGRLSSLWYIVREEDTHGNQLIYSYDPGSGGLLCIRIESLSAEGHSSIVDIGYDITKLADYDYDLPHIARLTTTGKTVTYQNVAPPGSLPGAPYRILTSVTQPGNRQLRYNYLGKDNYSEVLGTEAYPFWLLFSATDLLYSQFYNTFEKIPAVFLTNQEILVDGTWKLVSRVVPTYKSGSAESFGDTTGADFSLLKVPQTPNQSNLVRTPSLPGPTQTYQFKFDSNNRIKEKTDPNSITTKYDYDPSYNLTSYTDGLQKTWTYQYDNKRNPEHIFEPRSDGSIVETRIIYDTNRFKKPKYLIQDAGGLALQTEFTYDAVTRDLNESKDPNLAVTKMFYTPSGNLRQITYPDNQVWSQTYDPNGTGAIKTRTIPAANQGDSPQTWMYDNDIFGNRRSSLSPNGDVTTTSYDERDRPKSVTLGQAGVSYTINTTYTEFDAVNSTADSTGHTTAIVYDDFFRPTTVTKSKNGVNTVTNVLYDGYDRVVKMTNPKQGTADVTTYGYDAGNRVVNVSYPGIANLEKYEYFEDGTLKKHIKTDLSSIVYEYEDKNLTKIKPGGGAAEVTMTYDHLNRPKTNISAGASYTYNYQGTRLHDIVESGVGSTVFAYDGSGRRTRRTDPDGSYTEYTYTERDQLKSVAVPAQNIGAEAIPAFGMSYIYEQDGLPKTTTYSNGVQIAQGYDARRRMTSKEYSKGATSLLKLGWEFNTKNQRTRKEVSFPGGSHAVNCTYSDRDQLLTSTRFSSSNDILPPANTTYTFDANNNLNNVTVVGDGDAAPIQTGVVGDGSGNTGTQTGVNVSISDQIINYFIDRTSLDTSVSQSYDLAGSLSSFISTSTDSQSFRLSGFSYDYKDQLTAISRLFQVPAQGAVITNSLTYKFDSSNRMKSQTKDGVESTYFWDGDAICKIYKGSVRESWYLLGQDREAIYKNGSWHVLFTDDQSSQMGSADSNGNFENVRLYLDYGNPRAPIGPKPYIQDDFGWQGAKFENSTILYYMRNRFYSPLNKTFIQRDPIRYGGGLNMYAFGSGDPINNTDPDGLAPDPKLVTTIGTIPRIRIAGFGLRGAAGLVWETVGAPVAIPTTIVGLGAYGYSQLPNGPIPPRTPMNAGNFIRRFPSEGLTTFQAGQVINGGKPEGAGAVAASIATSGTLRPSTDPGYGITGVYLHYPSTLTTRNFPNMPQVQFTASAPSKLIYRYPGQGVAPGWFIVQGNRELPISNPVFTNTNR